MSVDVATECFDRVVSIVLCLSIEVVSKLLKSNERDRELLFKKLNSFVSKAFENLCFGLERRFEVKKNQVFQKKNLSVKTQSQNSCSHGFKTDSTNRFLRHSLFQVQFCAVNILLMSVTFTKTRIRQSLCEQLGNFVSKITFGCAQT